MTETRRKRPDPDSPRRLALRRSAVTLAVIVGMLAAGGSIEGARQVSALQHQETQLREQAAMQRHQAAVLHGAVKTLQATVRRQRRAIRANCAFDLDLGSAPLPATSPQPSKLAVAIISDTRAAWRQIRCPGPALPPPGRELLRLQHRYHIKPG